MTEFKKMSYDELIMTCKERKEGYEYLQFKELFELKEGTFTYDNYRINLNGEITLITYNNKIDIKIDYYNDDYNENVIYLSKTIIKENYKILIYCKERSINTKNSYLIKIKEEYKNRINIEYLYYYLEFNYDFILNNYYGSYMKRLNIDKLNEMIIVLPSLETQNQIVNLLQRIKNSLQ